MTNGAERRAAPDSPDGVTGGWRWLIHSDIEDASDAESRIQSTQIPTIIRAFIGNLLRLQGAAQGRNLQSSKLERQTSYLAIPVRRNSVFFSYFAPISRFSIRRACFPLFVFHNQHALDWLAAQCLPTLLRVNPVPKNRKHPNRSYYTTLRTNREALKLPRWFMCVRARGYARERARLARLI